MRLKQIQINVTEREKYQLAGGRPAGYLQSVTKIWTRDNQEKILLVAEWRLWTRGLRVTTPVPCHAASALPHSEKGEGAGVFTLVAQLTPLGNIFGVDERHAEELSTHSFSLIWREVVHFQKKEVLLPYFPIS